MTQPAYSSPSADLRPMGGAPKRKVGSRFTSGHLLMIVSALLAFLLTMIVLSSRSETKVVFVAKDDIVAGKLITDGQFTAKEVPSGALDSKYATQDAVTSGKNFAARSISKGEPLLVGALTPEANKSNVRLLSIPLDKKYAVNGNLARGDRIDVIATPEEGCAYRALSNIEIVQTPTTSSGGALGGGNNTYALVVALDRAGQDLILAGVINTGKFQVVKSTGAKSSNNIISDPQCGSAPEENSDSGSGGV